MTSNIQVICRFRPLPSNCNQMNFSIYNNESVLVDGGTYNYDRVFCPGTQLEVYKVAAEPVILGVLDGFNGTVVAYGQTASGKTYTMNGYNQDESGVIPRMVETVFNHIGDSPDTLEFRIKVSVVELYMEKIRDLLNPNKQDLKIREDKQHGVYIQDVTENYIGEEDDINQILKISQENRQISTTMMNEQSSRSHMIFIMTITTSDNINHSAKTGRLFLVDLAGSEKVSKTNAEGKTLDEAKGINKSLSTLGQVINALTQTNISNDKSSQHIPYRSSKLTRILQCSFGGNSRTSLIITCSQDATNLNETLSTLRFGTRAKCIKNKPKINKEYTTEELKNILSQRDAEIKILKEKLSNNIIQANEIDVKDSTRLEENYLNEIECSQDELQELKNENGDLKQQVEKLVLEKEQLQMKLVQQQNQFQSQVKFKEEEMQEALEQQMAQIQKSTKEKEMKANQIYKNITSALRLTDQSTSYYESSLTNLEETVKLIENFTNDITDNIKTQLLIEYKKIHSRAEEDAFIKILRNIQKQEKNNIYDQLIKSNEMLIQEQNNFNQIQREYKKLLDRIQNSLEQKNHIESNDIEDLKNKIEELEKKYDEEKVQKDLIINKNIHQQKQITLKITTLEQNLSDLLQLFHENLYEKSQFQTECQILERKLYFKERKLKTLEEANIRLSEENQTIFIKYDSLRELVNLDNFKNNKLQNSEQRVQTEAPSLDASFQQSHYIRKNISKPLLGGKQISSHKSVASVSLNNKENTVSVFEN